MLWGCEVGELEGIKEGSPVGQHDGCREGEQEGMLEGYPEG